MKWRDQLALLLGTASPFGLAASPGLAADAASSDETVRSDPPEIQKDLLVFRDPADRERLLLFAGHRSHSSHSSHRSHSSHYSGSSGHSSHSSHYSSSGGYVTPAPAYTLPPAPKPRPVAHPPAPKPQPAPSQVLETPDLGATPGATPRQRLTTDEVASMVTKVQVALVIRGYDPGPVDGKFGAKTKIALGRFQAANNLPISAAMDLETLRLLGVDVGMASRAEVKPPPPPISVAAGRAPTIINPDWARKPTGEDMARYYPDRAQRMEVDGQATISCVVTAKGSLEDCTIISESPEDFGFGDAALKLSRLFRMKPKTLDGASVDGGIISLPIVFRVPR